MKMSSTNMKRDEDYDSEEEKDEALRTTLVSSFTSKNAQQTSSDELRSVTPATNKYRRGSSNRTITPSSNGSPSIERSAARWYKKRKTIDVEGFSSENEEKETTLRRSRRRRTATVVVQNSSVKSFSSSPSTTSSHRHNNNNDDDVQIMKVKSSTMISERTDRKVASVSSDKMKKVCQDKASTFTSTFESSITSLGFLNPSPPFSEQPLCKHCGNRGYACHNYIYGNYCTKACLHYLHHNTFGWDAGFDPNTMEKTFANAYNEKRRVELEERHGYYSQDWKEVPRCMKLKSMAHAVTLGDNPILCSQLTAHNDAGRKKYLEAKRNFKG